MTRRMVAIAATLAVAGTARADPPAAHDPIAAEEAWIGIGDAPDPACDNPDPLAKPGEGTIVVCRRVHRDKYRVPSTAETDPKSAQALHTGALAPPDVYTHPACLTVCVTTGFGWAPPPIYYFDVSKLPLPPPGSDADRIAKGEAPAP